MTNQQEAANSNADSASAKICPVVLRRVAEELQILAFRHPQAGCQLVKGSVEPGETPRDAVVRELKEESGLSASKGLLDLGQSRGIMQGEVWHFFACPVGSLPEEWTHNCKDDEAAENGLNFDFFWLPMDAFIDKEEWDPRYIRAIRHVQARAEKLNASQLNAIAPQANDALSNAIIKLAKERGGDKSICPSEVARHMAGQDETEWRKLMKPIREEAVRLAKNKSITIMRKGKPVDPDNFKGIYRIGLAKD